MDDFEKMKAAFAALPGPDADKRADTLRLAQENFARCHALHRSDKSSWWHRIRGPLPVMVSGLAAFGFVMVLPFQQMESGMNGQVSMDSEAVGISAPARADGFEGREVLIAPSARVAPQAADSFMMEKSLVLESDVVPSVFMDRDEILTRFAPSRMAGPQTTFARIEVFLPTPVDVELLSVVYGVGEEDMYEIVSKTGVRPVPAGHSHVLMEIGPGESVRVVGGEEIFVKVRDLDVLEKFEYVLAVGAMGVLHNEWSPKDVTKMKEFIETVPHWEHKAMWQELMHQE